jgi:sarcosine oxidase gamma subunit
MSEEPIARGPLVERHRSAGATLTLAEGREGALRYAHEPPAVGNVLVDLSPREAWDLGGPNAGDVVLQVCGQDVPPRRVLTIGRATVYRLTQDRALLFDAARVPDEAVAVTGGWASLVLAGPRRMEILGKITAVDLRPRTFPVGACCLGPVFGVVTLFGQLPDRVELNVPADAAEFFWDVLLDAGTEFDLRPAGVEFLHRSAGGGTHGRG